jgi:methyl-accepting chemotaxis protein
MVRVSQDIQEVRNAAATTANQVAQVKTSAGELSKMAVSLQKMVRKFKV